VVTRKWENNIVYNRDNYFKEDEGNVEISTISSTKCIYKIPNKHNKYFKLKSNKIIRKLKLYKFLTFIEQYLKWTKFNYFDNERDLYYKSRAILNKKSFDFVLTSGEPFVLFKYARNLKREFNIPIALDYRDGWSTNSQRNSSRNIFHKMILWNEKRVENRIISESDILLFASETLRESVTKEFNIKKQPLQEVINNGVKFLDEIPKKKHFLKEEKFYIAFIGSLYEDHNIDLFLDSIEETIIKHNCKNIILVFVGALLNCPTFHKNKIESFKRKFKENTLIIDYLNNTDAIKIQFESSILLKFNSFEQKKGHFGKKLYEYAFSGKKVLAIDKKEGFNHELDFFDDRPFVYNCNVKEQITSQTLSFYNQWQNNEPLLNDIKREELIPYSTKNQTKLLEQILFSYLN